MVKVEIGEADRVKAIDRALRMARLFQKDSFETIMNILYDTGSESQKKERFEEACRSFGLTAEDTADLWKYMKHYMRRPGGGDPGW